MSKVIENNKDKFNDTVLRNLLNVVSELNKNKVMAEYHSQLRPLISDIDNLRIGDYLANSTYERLVVTLGIGQVWQDAMIRVENARRVYAFGFDHKPGDSEDAFKLLIDSFYKSDVTVFYKYIYATLKGFIEWNNNEMNLDNIFEDLSILSFPKDWLEELKKMHAQKEKIIKENRTSNSSGEIDNDAIIEQEEILKTKKNEWRKMLRMAKIEDVIEQIGLYSDENNNSSLGEKITNQSSRYYRIKGKVRDGVIDLDAENLEMNKINKSILEIIENI